MTIISQQLQQPYVGEYVELIDIDLTSIGGAVIYIVPGQYSTTPIVWRGHTYEPLPLETAGFDLSTEGAPPQPTLRVSNVSRFMMAAVISLNDMVGGKVTRWRTFAKYLDGQPEADSNQHLPIQQYIIAQKNKLTPFEVEFRLMSVLDLPGSRLPKRQILRDKGFPGAAITGARSR